jgi:hypothetical protein
MIPKSLPHNARETNLELKVQMQEGEEMQSMKHNDYRHDYKIQTG